jgi:uncharacterized protein YciI
VSKHVYVAISEPSEKWAEDKGVIWKTGGGKEYVKKFVEDGTLIRAGRYNDPKVGAGVAWFTTQEAAEAYVAGDPFLKEGLVTGAKIYDFIEVG